MSNTSAPVVNPVPKGFPPLPAHWKAEGEVFVSSRGGEKLFSAHWLRRDGSLGNRVLFILHGQGEHGGRYQHFAHYLDSAVGHVIALDHRGHGRSTGQRGHVDRFDDYVDDAAAVIEAWMKRLSSQEPEREFEFHLLGHSMGGLIATRLLWKRADLPFKSATLSAPLYGLAFKPPAIKKALAVGISRIWSTLPLSNELDASNLSHDPEVVKAYLEDRLNHDRVTPKFFVELQSAMAHTLRDALHAYTSPLFFIVAGDDRIVDSQATKSFFERLEPQGALEKKLKEYPDFFHESFNEVHKEQPFQDLAQWIQKNSSSSN